jgi:integrase
MPTCAPGGRTPARREVSDEKVPGLIARGEPSGNPTFHIRKRTPTGRVRVSLGAYPVLSLKRAREEALKALAAIQAGHNPAAERRASRAAHEAERALSSVTALLREWRDAKDREWSARHSAEVRRIAEKEIEPALGKRALRSTTRKDWTDLVAKKRKTAPAMASLLYRTISAFLGHAEAAGWIDMPLLPRKGMVTLAPTPEARDRVLTDAELRAIWIACDKLGARSRALVRRLMLTGARLGEVAGIDMSEIDIDAARWTIPGKRTKNGVNYTLPLCALALAEIKAAGPALRGFSGFSKLKKALDEHSGVSNWVMHDLRRSMRTNLSRLGVPREVAEACVNHISGRSGLVGVYDRYDHADQIIVAIGRWQATWPGLFPVSSRTVRR